MNVTLTADELQLIVDLLEEEVEFAANSGYESDAALLRPLGAKLRAVLVGPA